MTARLVFAVMFVFFCACGGEKKRMADAITERDSLPAMKTYGVETFISDSGVIRYKILADEWLVYDRKKTPYWAFEKGIYLEKFDSLHNVEASIVADTAYYYTNERLWTLKNNVDINNVKGERFQTDKINWDESKKKIYSDEYIKITQLDKIITGYGFESNQDMTKYVINNITGIFYVEDEDEPDEAAADSIG